MDFTLKEMDSTTTQAPIPVTPEKQQVLFAYHENYTSDWYSELQDEEMTLYSYTRLKRKRVKFQETIQEG